ncbi:MAG: FAD-binding protein [Acidobacteria bacterium]|nr:FAD-binding protein [Acidobacteriota bacterium]
MQVKSGHQNTTYRDLENDLKKVVAGEVRFDAYSRALYSTDASIFRIEPIGVVIPRTKEDVAAAMEITAKYKTPVLPRGGGTSLAGQAIGHAVVFDFSKYMNRVLEIDAAAKRVKLQAGVVLEELNRGLRPHGLFFPPDPATATRCNIGGMIGNNSSGSRSIVYGKTVDYVHSLRLLLSGAESMQVGPLSPLELDGKLQSQTREGAIYRECFRIADQNREEINARYPKIMRRVGGYNLETLLNRERINLGQVITGSEGTLAAIVEAEIGLVPRPKATALLVAHFAELMEALEATQVILETGPSAVELVDKIVLEMTRSTQEYRRCMTFVEGDPSALLLIEYSGDSSAEVASRLDQVEGKLRRAGMGYAFLKAIDSAAQANVWKVRNAGQGLLLGMVGDRKPATFVEDTAVAPEKLPAYIARFKQIVEEHGTTACFYAHASVGCLHIRPLVDLKQTAEQEKLRSIAEAVSNLVLEFGGSLSGEHGDGLVRSPFNQKMFGPRLYNAFGELKRAFDPECLMNPGKVVDASSLQENMQNLRLRAAISNGTGREARPYLDLNQTAFDFSGQGGFARAIEMCSGVGACRKRTDGTMCPSYMVTGEEEHSTRGRAVLLQSAISGLLPSDELTSERMFQALDLCLECKGCKGECPANVDMAKLKYEFLGRYYKQHGIPWRARLFGETAKVNEAASRIRPLYNWSIRNGVIRRAMEVWLGIDRRRPLPPLAPQRFSRWLAEREAATEAQRHRDTGRDSQSPTVGLFVDTFTEYFYPSVGIAATRVLEAFGYTVRAISGKCCGRPLISKGLLDRAVENARSNIALLRGAADRRIPIVGLEPSCLLTFRDEYPDLLPGAESKRVAQNAFLLEEFLSPDRQHPFSPALNFSSQRALFHGHCHLKALVGSEPSLRFLRSVPGMQVEEVDSGCCGMAGSFGFEKEHYDVSIAIAERRLAPAVRALPHDGLIVAGGVSCRQQILHTTGKQPLHPAEVLARALDGPLV